MSIALETNIRANLSALSSVSKQLNITQERLATNKKVNSIVDSPSNFFAARNLNVRATQLNARLDSMGQAIQTITAANAGIDAIRNLIANAKALVNDALANASASTRRELGDQYNTVLEQAALVASDSGYQGVNLLASNQKLSIEFGQANGASALVVKGLDLQGQAGNGVSEVSATYTETRASKATVGAAAAVASVASQASAASMASAGSVESTGKVASVASQAFAASQASIASQGTAAGQASIGTVVSSASQASIASRAGVASAGTVQSHGTRGSQAEIASRASVAAVLAAATVGSISRTYTQSFAFSLQVTPGDNATTVGLRKHSGAQNKDGAGSHRLDFGTTDYLERLNDVTLELDAFDKSLQTQASRLATNLNVVTVRQGFTDTMISTLNGGADKLVLADMNEEGANLLALQTRHSLAIQSLSLSSQQSQQILRLLQ